MVRKMGETMKKKARNKSDRFQFITTDGHGAPITCASYTDAQKKAPKGGEENSLYGEGILSILAADPSCILKVKVVEI